MVDIYVVTTRLSRHYVVGVAVSQVSRTHAPLANAVIPRRC